MTYSNDILNLGDIRIEFIVNIDDANANQKAFWDMLEMLKANTFGEDSEVKYYNVSQLSGMITKRPENVKVPEWKVIASSDSKEEEGIKQ